MSGDASTDADLLWQRVAQLDAELASLDRSDFTRRAELSSERDEAVHLLRQAHADDAQLNAWAQNSSATNPGRSAPYIPSHSEGGGT